MALSADPRPSSAGSSADSVVLSPAEASQISSALDQSKAALQASSEQIKAQLTQILQLKICCGALVAIDAGAVDLGLFEALRK